MNSPFDFTKKQLEYIVKANKRYNVKIGATGAGKTYLDVAYTIMQRLIERKNCNGLNVIIGYSANTIEENIFMPMRELFGSKLVGQVQSSKNKIRLFGQEAIVVGASNARQLSRLFGKTIKYAYCDEVARWEESIFNFLPTRLRTEQSVVDMTLNPEYPTHWFKKWLDKPSVQEDLYVQHYTIYDNPKLPASAVKDMENQYRGTISWDRYILGLWTRAEGVIYSKFADKPEMFIKPFTQSLVGVSGQFFRNGYFNGKINIGVDFGGTKSGTAFVATYIPDDYSYIHVLESERHVKKDSKAYTSDEIQELYVEFMDKICTKYMPPDKIYCDTASSTQVADIRQVHERYGFGGRVVGATKMRIIERIKFVLKMLNIDKMFLTPECLTLIDALITAVYNPDVEDQRLDNGTTDIDTLDAFEYSIENEIAKFVNARWVA